MQRGVFFSAGLAQGLYCRIIVALGIEESNLPELCFPYAGLLLYVDVKMSGCDWCLRSVGIYYSVNRFYINTF